MPTCLITGASGGVATALAARLRGQDWLDGGFLAVRPLVRSA